MTGIGVRLFDNRSSFILLLLMLPLLFLPKVNLLHFQEETAGVRLDDCILCGFGILLFWAFRQRRQSFISTEKWVGAITLFAAVSFFLNHFFVHLGWLLVPAKVFYVVRIAEYFLFFYVGAFCVRIFPISKVLLLFVGWNAFLVLCQKGGLLGSLTVEGYVSDVSERVTGIASFPNELALCMSLLFCFFAFRKESQPLTVIPIFLLCALIMIWSGSRISLVALAIAFLGYLWVRKAARFWIVPLVPTLLALFIFIMGQTESLTTRSQGLGDVGENLRILPTLWEMTNPDSMDWDALPQETLVDASWWLRAQKWCHALKLYVEHPESYLTGIGPGFATAALDGGLLRILVEYGAIGIALFAGLFLSIARVSPIMRWMTLVLLIHMIFIDAHLSYKGMSLYFFTLGSEVPS